MVFILHVVCVSPSISTSYLRCFPIIKLLILHIYHGLAQVVCDHVGSVKSVLQSFYKNDFIKKLTI